MPKKNPLLMLTEPSLYKSTIAIGVEASDIINVAVQLKNRKGRNIAEATRVKCNLFSNAAGTLLAAPPTGGVYAGSVGTLIQGTDHLRDGLVNKATLIIDATNTAQFSTSATATVRVRGITATKTAAVDLTFTAAHVITASKFGVILVQMTAGGTISTKVPASPQAYNSAALALAALPVPDAANVALGYIAIANNTGDWTANTDDLVNASDVTTAAFVDAVEQFGPSTFDVISNALGAFNFNIRDTGTPTMYVGVQMPDGRMKMSGAVTFA